MNWWLFLRNLLIAYCKSWWTYSSKKHGIISPWIKAIHYVEVTAKGLDISYNKLSVSDVCLISLKNLIQKWISHQFLQFKYSSLNICLDRLSLSITLQLRNNSITYMRKQILVETYNPINSTYLIKKFWNAKHVIGFLQALVTKSFSQKD